jgi:hypothetical protein
MPTIPSANTNATSIMIGEFVSRLLVAGRAAAGLGRDTRLSTASTITTETFLN